MITDSKTNSLYLADTLPKRYPAFYKRFEKALVACEILYSMLPQTKDVWAVDFMPIQIETDNFVRFTYDPTYLKSKKLQKTISDSKAICDSIGINCIESDIILDGGNVIKAANKVITTERVFKDNPQYDRTKLIDDLSGLLGIEYIYIIPEQPNDFTGHTDGMVRLLDDHTLLINDFMHETKDFQRAFETAIQNTGLNCIKIPYNPYNNKNYDDAKGNYMNYLQMKDIIILPTFHIIEDDVVVKQFENLFPGRNITTIKANELAADGGILNCITWNIKTSRTRAKYSAKQNVH